MKPTPPLAMFAPNDPCDSVARLTPPLAMLVPNNTSNSVIMLTTQVLRSLSGCNVIDDPTMKFGNHVDTFTLRLEQDAFDIRIANAVEV